MSRSKSQGFTLVELLVVIAIIGVLVSLLLPAVQMAREAARRAQCTNQLRQLALGAANFASSKGRMPPSQERLFPNDPVRANQRPASWFVLLAPYLGQQPIWDNWSNRSTSTANLTTPFVPVLHCPSKGTPNMGTAANSYICNAGFYPRFGLDPAYMNWVPPSPFSFQVLQRKANGVFSDRANCATQVSISASQQLKISVSDMTDGASYTALFSENITAAEWTQTLPRYPLLPSISVPDSNIMVWLNAAESTAPPPSPLAHSPNSITRAIIPTTAPTAPMRINGKGAPGQTCETWRPSSRHPGVVVMAFADGSTKTISEQITYYVYQCVLTPANLKSDMPQCGYILSGSDLP